MRFFSKQPQVSITLKLGLFRDKNTQSKSESCDRLQSHTHSENNLPKISLNWLLRPELSDELLKPESIFQQIYSSIYQRCRQTTSKAPKHRNRYKLGRPISVGQEIFLENHAQDLTESGKLKQPQVGPFAVTKQIMNTTYEIREYASPTMSKLRIKII